MKTTIKTTIHRAHHKLNLRVYPTCALPVSELASVLTHGIILGSVLDRVVYSLIISLAIAENVYGVGVTIVIFSVIQYKHDSLI